MALSEAGIFAKSAAFRRASSNARSAVRGSASPAGLPESAPAGSSQPTALIAASATIPHAAGSILPPHDLRTPLCPGALTARRPPIARARLPAGALILGLLRRRRGRRGSRARRGLHRILRRLGLWRLRAAKQTKRERGDKQDSNDLHGSLRIQPTAKHNLPLLRSLFERAGARGAPARTGLSGTLVQQ